MTDLPSTVVTAAVIEREGRFLVARRLEGTHLAGHWEFPGGKCEAGEELAACLAREIREELGATVRVGAEIFRTTYVYPDRAVELRFFGCALDGEPQPMLGQQIRWVSREELGSLRFPPADAELIDLLCGTPLTTGGGGARQTGRPRRSGRRRRQPGRNPTAPEGTRR